MTSYRTPDTPKMLRETLCVAQTRIGASGLDAGRTREHVDRLQRLIDACDAHRPIGPDGKHGDRHTPTCGCEVEATAEAVLIAHQRRDFGSCLCGWGELGKSHAGHQVVMLREAGLLAQ